MLGHAATTCGLKVLRVALELRLRRFSLLNQLSIQVVGVSDKRH
jgi:hypothetical protein